MAGSEKLRGVRGWWRGVPVRVADSFLDGVPIGAGEVTNPRPIVPGDTAWSSKPSPPAAPAPVCPPPAPPAAAPGRTRRTPGGGRFVSDAE